MAIRLAFDLGLHTSTRRYVDDGAMTIDEANARNVTLWGCFLNDRLVFSHTRVDTRCTYPRSRGWGMYLGRPFHTDIQNISAERPNSLGTQEMTTWTAYGLFEHSADDSTNVSPHSILLDRSVELCNVMSPLGHSL